MNAKFVDFVAAPLVGCNEGMHNHTLSKADKNDEMAAELHTIGKSSGGR